MPNEGKVVVVGTACSETFAIHRAREFGTDYVVHPYAPPNQAYLLDLDFIFATPSLGLLDD